MFGRLLKHEFKSTWKEFCILFGIMILAGILLGGAIRSQINELIAVVAVIFSGAIFALFLIGILYLFRISGKTVYEKQGYLTFSIPVTAHELLISKIIAIMTYAIGIYLSVIISVEFMILIIEPSAAKDIFDTIYYHFQYPALLGTGILWNFFQLLSAVIALQFCYALANSGIFHGKRNVVVVFIIIALYVIIGILNAVIHIDYYLCFSSDGAAFIGRTEDIIERDCIARYSFWSLGFDIVLSVLLYFFSVRIIENKLELE